MDGILSISPLELYATVGTAAAPAIIDARREAAFAADDRMLVSAVRQSTPEVGKWGRDVPAGQLVVVYCVHGDEVSQQAAAALRGIELF